ncbi:hypothetical protein SAMN02745975_01805 [Geosporobacter subterraneus DSM 17957]|uniref:Zinc-ribbon domain-containing protein n=1 Tax=Geosporobacter subterraneus DSM 17957 TaxID=1121919 RepID=A0A1M6IBV2_9FIRM|nr:hypothetical protein [Geosporobacter subterraneus]SHJ31921.1 hypothetical protein SAMN02745975_01805 [Geosporobacter subterraneus DSM 17957]
MEFFNKLGQKVSEGSRVLSDTTDKLLEIADNKLAINRLEAEIDEIKMLIGELVFKNYLGKSVPPALIQEKCEELERLFQEVARIRGRLVQMKGVTYCRRCGSQVRGGDSSCQTCGYPIV